MEKEVTTIDTEAIKELIKESKYSFNVSDFIDHANRYISAIRDGRMICNIESVSRSGMSRRIKFMECAKNQYTERYQYLQFYAFFRCMGYSTHGRNYNSFLISGCGMDMIFHTNYTIIHKLYRLGFLTKEECSSLAQETPTVI